MNCVVDFSAPDKNIFPVYLSALSHFMSFCDFLFILFPRLVQQFQFAEKFAFVNKVLRNGDIVCGTFFVMS